MSEFSEGSSVGILEKEELPKHQPETEQQISPDKNGYAMRLDEVRDKARGLTERIKEGGSGQLSGELRNELWTIQREGRDVFENYFKETIGTENGKKIIAFINPELTPEDIENAHEAFLRYQEIHIQTPGGQHTPEKAALREKLQKESEPYFETLQKYSLGYLSKAFASHDFGRQLEPLWEYELSKLGLPIKYDLIENSKYTLPRLRATKNTAVVQEFFGPEIVDKIDAETYAEAWRKSLSDEKDDRGYSTSGSAIELLAQYPSPDVVRRLIAINQFDYRTETRGYGRDKYTTLYKGRNAMNALQEIKKSTDWEALVGQTIEKFSELKGIENKLKELKTRDNQIHLNMVNLWELEQAYATNYLLPLRLKLIPPPDDMDLAELYSYNPVQIKSSELKELGLITEDENLGLIYIPRDFRDKVSAPLYAVLEATETSREEKMDAINRLKQLGRLYFKVNESKSLIKDKSTLTPADRKLLNLVFDPEKDFKEVLEFLEIYSQYKDLYFPNNDVNAKFYEEYTNHEGFPPFIKFLSDLDPETFLKLAKKKDWTTALGTDIVSKFLEALPKENDEKRNAFTQNAYDRTTPFISFLLKSNQGQEFTLSPHDMEIVTEYVREFGLSQDALVYRYFTHLSQFEKGEIMQLPADIEKNGIRSLEDLKQAVERMRTLAYSDIAMTDLSVLTDFELANLRVVTGKARHRFNQGRKSFQQIISDFQRDSQEGQIAPLPDGYKKTTITLADTEIEFDISGIEEDYSQIGLEIWKAVRSDGKSWDITMHLKTLWNDKLEKINNAMENTTGGKKQFLTREMARFEAYKKSLESVDSLDSLMRAAITMKVDKSEQPEFKRIVRAAVLRNLFLKNPGYRDQMLEITESYKYNLNPNTILAIVDMIKDPIKEHVVNPRTEDYWSTETRAAMKNNKDNLRELFEPYNAKLNEAIENFQSTATGQEINISAIPDRGFIGEMSGYLADVCYTAEYPLLKGRNVVPYKFVTHDKETGHAKFIGSVLVFEVNTEDNEGALLIRGFDVPNESDYDIDVFIEKFLDQMADVARARGKAKVLVPGSTGAISNYAMTIDHIKRKYKDMGDASSEQQEIGPKKVALNSTFDFNGYDLTRNCYVAREVPPPVPVSSDV